jgi:hypothetical protein
VLHTSVEVDDNGIAFVKALALLIPILWDVEVKDDKALLLRDGSCNLACELLYVRDFCLHRNAVGVQVRLTFGLGGRGRAIL